MRTAKRLCRIFSKVIFLLQTALQNNLAILSQLTGTIAAIKLEFLANFYCKIRLLYSNLFIFYLYIIRFNFYMLCWYRPTVNFKYFNLDII
jgi:hypothetical protein